MNKLMLTLLGAMLVTAASAKPKVGNLVVTAYPASEKIEISYKVSGVSGDGCTTVMVSLSTMGTDADEEFVIGYLPHEGYGDNGTHTIVMNAATLAKEVGCLECYDGRTLNYYQPENDVAAFLDYLRNDIKRFDIVSVNIYDACTGGDDFSEQSWAYASTDNIKTKKSSSSSVSPVAAETYAKAMTKTGCVYDEDENLVGTASVKFGKISKKGVVKVSATITLFSGKKLTASGSFTADEEGYLYGSLKFNSPVGTLTLGAGADDGEFSFWIGNDAEDDGEYYVEERPVGGSLANGIGHFSVELDDDLEAPEGYEFIEDLLPEDTIVNVGQNGTKLSVSGKAPKVTFKKIREDGEVYYEPSWENGLWENPAGLKLTYKVKTGVLSGSFKVYATNVDYIEENRAPKVLTYTAKLSGVVIDGVGMGSATVKIGKATYSMPFYFDVEGD